MLAPSALRAPRGCVSRQVLGASTAAAAPPSARASFSTTAPQCKRKTKDSNKRRGVSSLYGSGPREPLSMSKMALPRPRGGQRPKVQTDAAHGLWGFFPAPGRLMLEPKEVEQHGRPWAVEELRRKSWEDLHALWWACCRERNMLATSRAELARAEMGFGQHEMEARDEEVTKTMRAIKHALTERYYTWQDAFEVAKSDPEINLEGGEGQVYTPAAYEEGYDEAGDGWGAVEGKGPAEITATATATTQTTAQTTTQTAANAGSSGRDDAAAAGTEGQEKLLVR
ncbi:54S ribosomal protein L4 [Escovopsis weberi]|uniref:Large ribosomal subunit protein uL29m n=1 Tax=Escovopsis weberi TaxID=150374 RepID=A0A0M8N161_ESCWE|nr:54S ribosomal protein L4 [Escovopsis weberi]